MDILGRKMEEYISVTEDKDTGKYRNFVDDPYLQEWGLGKSRTRNFCGCNNATGEEEPVPAPEKEAIPSTKLSDNVKDIRDRQVFKTILALIGLYAIGTYMYNKFIK